MFRCVAAVCASLRCIVPSFLVCHVYNRKFLEYIFISMVIIPAWSRSLRSSPWGACMCASKDRLAKSVGSFWGINEKETLKDGLRC